MDIALDQYLSGNPSITGSIVADNNGLLVSAKGELARNSDIKAGLFCSVAKNAQSLLSASSDMSKGVTVIIESITDKQILVRKVGEFTVAIQSNE